MYGEKVEETNELRLDLQDVKDMYKAQVIASFLNSELSEFVCSNCFSFTCLCLALSVKIEPSLS